MYEEMVLEIDYHLMSYLFRSHFDMWAEAFEINFTFKVTWIEVVLLKSCTQCFIS